MSADLRSDLLASGLLVDSGVAGLYARSGTFEKVVRGLDDLVSAAGADQRAPVLHFPPIIPKVVLEHTGYLRSFPDLLGAVSVFEGDDELHRELLELLDQGQDWTGLLTSSLVTLSSAACHSLYSSLSGRLPPGGRRFEVFGHCFRHEPSLDPARMQAFRQHEFVYVGEPDGAVAHRDMWLERSADLLSSLGLPVEAVVSNDPFFGRGPHPRLEPTLRGAQVRGRLPDSRRGTADGRRILELPRRSFRGRVRHRVSRRRGRSQRMRRLRVRTRHARLARHPRARSRPVVGARAKPPLALAAASRLQAHP